MLCCAEVDDARRLKEELGDAISPREFLEPRASTVITSTTNGTRTILEAASRCHEVLLGSLLNLVGPAAEITPS